MITETRAGGEIFPPTDEKEIKAIRLRLLDEYEGQIAGHDTLSVKTNPKTIGRDGLLRALNLERLTRGFLYTERNTDSQGNLILDHAALPHPDELFSFNDFVGVYAMVRGRHNDLYSQGKEGLKTQIPKLDRNLAHEFIHDQLKGDWLELAMGISLRDVDRQNKEDEKMFRFPPTEFKRKPGLVEEERELLKSRAFSILINERKGAWFSATDLRNIYMGLVDSSDYKGKVGMYFSITSADAFIIEKMSHDSLDETVVHKIYEFNGENYESEETIYRQTPLKR